LSKKENEAEQQLYAHRQRMLSDMEVIRRRDAESRRQAEDARQHAARQEMRCHELERDLEVKLAHVDKERADLAREREAEMARLRADMLRLRDEEQRELSAQRREVEEHRLQLQISRDSFGDAMAEAKVARDECVELSAENKRLARQLEAVREELQRKGEQCVEKEDECRRLDEEARRLQERVSELEASRRELAGSHFGDSVADTPHSMRSSRKGGGSPAKSQAGKSLGAMGVVDQLEELRASHGRERVLKEKQVVCVCVCVCVCILCVWIHVCVYVYMCVNICIYSLLLVILSTVSMGVVHGCGFRCVSQRPLAHATELKGGGGS